MGPERDMHGEVMQKQIETIVDENGGEITVPVEQWLAGHGIQLIQNASLTHYSDTADGHDGTGSDQDTSGPGNGADVRANYGGTFWDIWDYYILYTNDYTRVGFGIKLRSGSLPEGMTYPDLYAMKESAAANGRLSWKPASPKDFIHINDTNRARNYQVNLVGGDVMVILGDRGVKIRKSHEMITL